MEWSSSVRRTLRNCMSWKKHLKVTTSFVSILFCVLQLLFYFCMLICYSEDIIIDKASLMTEISIYGNLKVKRTILHLERWWGAHLPFYGREPVGG